VRHEGLIYQGRASIYTCVDARVKSEVRGEMYAGRQ
jgi:hypothetical protein